jgi:deoxyribonucleoside regulator
VASGYLDAHDLRRLERAGAVGDVLGRFVTADGTVALPTLDRRTVGLPLEELTSKALTVGVAAGPGKGPVALAALKAGILRHLVTEAATAEWVLRHG